MDGCYDPYASYLCLLVQSRLSFPIAGRSISKQQIIERVVTMLNEQLPDGYSDWIQHDELMPMPDVLLRMQYENSPHEWKQ